MGTGIRNTDEFKQKAVNQVVFSYVASEVVKRLGISAHKTVYKWKQEFSKSA